MGTTLALLGEKGEILIYQPDGSFKRIEVKIVGRWFDYLLTIWYNYLKEINL
jgi:hypothetical protein